MKHIFYGLFFCVVACCLPLDSLQAQWVHMNGPYGGYISSLTINGTNLFVGTPGVLLSTNNGTSWIAVNSGLTSGYVLALATVANGNVIAGTGDGIFVSSNGRSGWTQKSKIQATVFMENIAGIFGGTDGNDAGVYLSTDNGSSWNPMKRDLTNHSVTSLERISKMNF